MIVFIFGLLQRFKTMLAFRQGVSVFGKYGCLETVEFPGH